MPASRKKKRKSWKSTTYWRWLGLEKNKLYWKNNDKIIMIIITPRIHGKSEVSVVSSLCSKLSEEDKKSFFGRLLMFVP